MAVDELRLLHSRPYAPTSPGWADDGYRLDVQQVFPRSDMDDVDPDTRSDGLFWPQTLAWDGQRLWVGEYKFSGRVVGFARQ